MKLDRKWLLEFADNMEELAADARAMANFETSLKGARVLIDKTLNGDEPKEEELPKIISRPAPPHLPEKKKTTEEVENEMENAAVQAMAAEDNLPTEIIPTSVETIPADDFIEDKKPVGAPRTAELQAVYDFIDSGGDISDLNEAVEKIHQLQPHLDKKKLKQKVRDVKRSRS